MNMQLTNITTTFFYSTIALLSLMLGVAGSAQSAAYIKFDGVDGESQDNDHKGWSDLMTFDQALHQPGAGATGKSRRRGAAIVDDIQLQMTIDSATTLLQQFAAQGRIMSEVKVELCQGASSSSCDPNRLGDQHCYLKYELENVIVSSYQISTSGEADGRGVVNLALNFEDIQQEYIPAANQCPANFE